MIAKVKKIFLIGPTREFNQVFSFLQKKGVVEITRASDEIQKEKTTEKAFFEVTKKLQDLRGALEFLSDGKLDNIRPQVKTGFKVDEFIEKTLKLKEKIQFFKEEFETLTREKENLSFFLENFPLPFKEISRIRRIKIQLLTVAKKKKKIFESQIRKIPLSDFLQFQKTKKSFIYVVFYHPSQKIDYQKLGAERIELPENPQKKIAEIDKKLKEIDDELKFLYEEKRNLASFLPQAVLFYDYYENLKLREKHRLEDVFEKGKIFVLSGWIEEKIFPSFEKEILKKFPFLYIESRKPLKGENVPVILKNKKVFQPYEFLTQMYGTPAWDSQDPTPNMGVFFAFFFGLCLGDAFYGIVITILSIFLILKKGGKKFLWILFMGGIFTFLFGAITGGWLGDVLNRLPSQFFFIKRILESIIILDPVKGATYFIAIAIACGYIQVLWGIVLKCIDDIKQKEFPKFFLEDISSILIQISIFFIISVYMLKIFTIPKVLSTAVFISLVVGIFSIIGYNLYYQQGLIFKILWSYYGVYSVITGTAFSDIISYIRLFALGLTTGLLAQAINELVWFVGSANKFLIPFALLLFIVGHAFNLGINAIGAFCHTLRLQYYEFFTKFIRTGGHYFKPVKNFVKYTLH